MIRIYSLGFVEDDLWQPGLDFLTLILYKECPEVSTVLNDAFSQLDGGQLADL